MSLTRVAVNGEVRCREVVRRCISGQHGVVRHGRHDDGLAALLWRRQMGSGGEAQWRRQRAALVRCSGGCRGEVVVRRSGGVPEWSAYGDGGAAAVRRRDGVAATTTKELR